MIQRESEMNKQNIGEVEKLMARIRELDFDC